MPKMNLKRIVLVLGLLAVFCVIVLNYGKFFSNESERLNIPPPDKNLKSILYYMPMFARKDWYYGVGTEPFKNCTFTNCYATYDKHVIPIEEFDAIIFHGCQYTVKRYGKPKKRNQHQMYIFGNLESPANTPQLIRDMKYFYNWTMTYRRDSDVLRPYGYIDKRRTPYELPSVEDIQKRPKKIAWLVSNCKTQSKRELLYEEMNKYIPIDVYGDCYNLTCPKSIQTECYEMIEKEYKFYLSFENSVCEDYVTEKLYTLLYRNIVPIVYGGVNYTEYAPPHSVINVMDFKSVPDLVEYIIYLDEHPEEYLKYFEWKKHSETNRGVRAICNLCDKLNQPIVPKTYSDIATWWYGENSRNCSTSFITDFL